ncbi:MAG TPA: hypothetical protein VH352_07715, partial [Pseudonocardiaceae bacterium]|nr:hypothetical protein [Pseudonocardiaceae bacterium]
MITLGVAVLLLAVAIGLLYALSYGMVVLVENLVRHHRKRRVLAKLTGRLHELLAEAGHPPVRRRQGGRHRLRADTGHHRPVVPALRTADLDDYDNGHDDFDDFGTDTGTSYNTTTRLVVVQDSCPAGRSCPATYGRHAAVAPSPCWGVQDAVEEDVQPPP